MSKLKVLFSPLGSSDFYGNDDIEASFLSSIRNVVPDEVYLYVSEGVGELYAEDPLMRVEVIARIIDDFKRVNNLEFNLHLQVEGVDGLTPIDINDFFEVMDRFYRFVGDAVDSSPAIPEIHFNVTSGTPTMKEAFFFLKDSLFPQAILHQTKDSSGKIMSRPEPEEKSTTRELKGDISYVYDEASFLHHSFQSGDYLAMIVYLEGKKGKGAEETLRYAKLLEALKERDTFPEYWRNNEAEIASLGICDIDALRGQDYVSSNVDKFKMGLLTYSYLIYQESLVGANQLGQFAMSIEKMETGLVDVLIADHHLEDAAYQKQRRFTTPGKPIYVTLLTKLDTLAESCPNKTILKALAFLDGSRRVRNESSHNLVPLTREDFRSRMNFSKKFPSERDLVREIKTDMPYPPNILAAFYLLWKAVFLGEEIHLEDKEWRMEHREDSPLDEFVAHINGCGYIYLR